MKTHFSLILGWLTVLLLLASPPASAQLQTQKLYGTAGTEQQGYLTPARAGGYLLVGTQVRRATTVRKLYLVRTTGQGDTLWTRAHRIAGFANLFVQATCENAAGQVLVTAIGGTTDVSQALLVLLSPQGDTLWTRKTSGPTYNFYSGLLLGNDGNFVLTASLNTFPQWLKIDSNGRVLDRTFINYDANNIGALTNLFKDNSGRSGYWLVDVNGNSVSERKFLHLTEAGVIDQSKPLFGEASDYIRSIAPIPNQAGYMMCERGRISRFTAALDTVWTKVITYTNGFVTGYASPSLVQSLPDGNFVLAGQFFNAGGERVYLGKITPNGQMLRDTVLFRLGGSELVRGLAVEPLTGRYVFSGEATQGPLGQADLFLGIHANWRVLSTRPARAPVATFQAWPNPISAARPELTLRADRALSGELRLTDLLGRIICTWPTTRALAEFGGQRLNLTGVSPGLYLLTGAASDGRRYQARIVCE